MEFDLSNASNIIINKLSVWLKELVRLMPNLVLAAVVLAVGIIFARLIRKAAQRILMKMLQSITLVNLFSSVIYFVSLGVIFFTVLSILNLDKAVTSILAGAGILGLALAFAFQDIASNFISGIFISFRKPIQVGDIVQVKDYLGKIQEINLRDTVMQTFRGQTVIIPNKDVFQNPIENYSYRHKRRFDLTVGVSYGEDLEKVRQITLDAVRDIEYISKTEETTLFFTEFSDSSINFSLRMWIDSAEQLLYMKTGHEAIMRIKKAYDENDIVIPFPIRTLDFGIKGGKSLNEMDLNVVKQDDEDA